METIINLHSLDCQLSAGCEHVQLLAAMLVVMTLSCYKDSGHSVYIHEICCNCLYEVLFSKRFCLSLDCLFSFAHYGSCTLEQ